MFNLTSSELDCAKAAIEHHGYSTLLPHPPEWDDVVEHWYVVKGYLSSIDLECYTPRQPLVITVAKDERSVRLVHLLHPEDLLLYTALTLLVKSDLEEARLPRIEAQVYSYRASDEDEKLYESVRETYRNYTARLKHKARCGRTEAVAVIDIADFYASISHQQLKQLLRSAAQAPRATAAADLLVTIFAKSLMAREGHGVPTGPLASRLLAEVVLNEIDKYLAARPTDFVRWVDDYNIFAESLASARDTVIDLAAWLYKTHGLTLQSSKTHVLSCSDYAERFLVDVEDKLSDRTEIVQLLQAFDHDYDEPAHDVDEFMDDLHAVELLELLVGAITNEDGTDFRVVGFAVRRLRRMSLDQQVAEEILEITLENITRLAPVIAEVAPLVVALIADETPKDVGQLLFQSLGAVRVDHYAAWILTIFAERPRKAFLDSLVDVYQKAESNVVRRFAALAIAKAGGTVSLERRKWELAPPMVRLALLRARGRGSMRAHKLDGELEKIVAGLDP